MNYSSFWIDLQVVRLDAIRGENLCRFVEFGCRSALQPHLFAGVGSQPWFCPGVFYTEVFRREGYNILAEAILIRRQYLEKKQEGDSTISFEKSYLVDSQHNVVHVHEIL